MQFCLQALEGDEGSSDEDEEPTGAAGKSYMQEQEDLKKAFLEVCTCTHTATFKLKICACLHVVQICSCMHGVNCNAFTGSQQRHRG